MKLYKYLSPERIDVLSSGLIRFTQPALFNDPFEMSPNISAIASEEEIDKIFDAKHEGQDQEQYLKHNRASRRKNPLESFKKGYTKEVLLPRIKNQPKARHWLTQEWQFLSKLSLLLAGIRGYREMCKLSCIKKNQTISKK